MERNKIIRACPVGNLRLFKGSLIDILCAGVEYVDSLAFQQLSYFQRQFQIVVFFLAAVVDRSRVGAAMRGAEHAQISGKKFCGLI